MAKAKIQEVAQPLIIQYTNLLHAWRDVNAKEVKEFLEAHADDAAFTKRAQVVNKLFKIKESARV